METLHCLWRELICGFKNTFWEALPLIISTIVGTWIVRKAFHPKVKIKAKKEHVLEDDGGYFLSLNIVNVGPNVAQQCCAYIILDTKIKSKDLLNPIEADSDEHLPQYTDEKPNFEFPRNTLITRDKQRDVQQIQLCWTHHGNPYQKDINPGVQAQIDICRYQCHIGNPKQDYIAFPTERGWRRIHFRTRNRPLYGKLYICPANSYPYIFKIQFQMINNCPPTVSIRKKHLNIFTHRRLLLK